MKRWIKGSSFKNISAQQFENSLVAYLRKKLNPVNETDYWVYPSYNQMSGWQVIVEGVSSQSELDQVLEEALEKMGYQVYDIRDVDDEGYQYAAVDGEAFVKLISDFGDYFNNGPMGYIDMKFDNGNVLFQDWYEVTD